MMGGWGNMMNGWGNCYGGGYGIGMMGFMMPLVFGIAIILLAVFLFRRNTSRLNVGEFNKYNRGLDILRERYARGEIDSAEYQSRKHDLESR